MKFTVVQTGTISVIMLLIGGAVGVCAREQNWVKFGDPAVQASIEPKPDSKPQVQTETGAEPKGTAVSSSPFGIRVYPEHVQKTSRITETIYKVEVVDRTEPVPNHTNDRVLPICRDYKTLLESIKAVGKPKFIVVYTSDESYWMLQFVQTLKTDTGCEAVSKQKP